jgi:thiamine pyrophosphate-dependent acetolactate synthase large subunit-like protein
MVGKTGNKKIIEQFLLDDMNVMFGCPGTVEQGWLNVLREYPKMKYFLNLQESVAVMMADGYARATQKPTLVQLHSSPGIGNAVGALYQAMRGHAPLVVIAGDAGLKYFNMDAQMAGDLVGMMKPVTKFATCVYHHDNLLRTIRRAIKIASTPPMGPVYVCLPADVMDEINSEPLFPTSIPSTRVIAENSLIKQAAHYLANAKNPMIFMGDGVAYSQANEELTEVAEILGAEVYGVDCGELNMSNNHPLFMGQTGHMFGFASVPKTQKGDGVLVVGTYMMPEVFPLLTDIYNPEAKIIHIDLNAYEIAKNHRVDIGVVADPKLSLNALAEELKKIITPTQKNAAKKRIEQCKVSKENILKEVIAKDDKTRNEMPMSPAFFMKELAKHVPKDVMIFDEALTASPELNRYLPPTLSGHFFQIRGGSLGAGFPGAIGVKIANPDKVVIGFCGDGGSMFTIQALATAARYNIDVKFVVCNNHSYKLLELNIMQYRKEQNLPDDEFPDSFFLDNPDISFTMMAESMKVPAIRVEKYEDIKPGIEKMLSTKGPFLIDLVISSNIEGHSFQREKRT